jgi:hypothetical protein
MFRPAPGRVVDMPAEVFAEVVAPSEYLWRLTKVTLPLFWVG